MSAPAFLSGLRWTALATVVNFVAQFVFLGVLARLLDPATFGLMAMTAIVLRFASFFAQMGVGQALIQKSDLSPEEVSAALVLALLVSSVLYCVLWLAAPLAATYFNDDSLTHLVRWAGLTLLLSSPGSVALAYLRRVGRFAALSGVEVGSYLLGYGLVGITCAYAGLGVWSLVIAAIAQAALLCVLGFLVARPPLRFLRFAESARHFWTYGTKHSLVGFLEFVSANLETLYMGRFSGAHALGLYNRAQVVSNLPVEQSVNALSKVVFPLLSRTQNDEARLSEFFLTLLLGIGLVAVPLSMLLSAAAADVVVALFGQRWLEAIPILAWLALGVPALFMYVACGITLDSLAALRQKLMLQALAMLFKLTLLLWLARWGLHGIVLAVVFAEYLRLAMGLWVCQRRLRIPLARLGGILFRVVGMGVCTYACVFLVNRFMPAQAWVWGRLMAEIFLAGMASASLAALMLRYLPSRSPWRHNEVMGWLLPRLPACLAPR